MNPFLHRYALPLALCAASLSAAAQSGRPASSPGYASAFSDYQPFREIQRANWREVNAAVVAPASRGASGAAPAAAGASGHSHGTSPGSGQRPPHAMHQAPMHQGPMGQGAHQHQHQHHHQHPPHQKTHPGHGAHRASPASAPGARP